MTMPVTLRQNSLTNPSRLPCILARGLPRSRSTTSRAGTTWSSTCCWLTPTVAISGVVNTFEDTVSRSSGATASPSACHMAMRPCIAATEASGSTPVQSPAAYTPRALVRETRSTTIEPLRSVSTRVVSRPRSSVLGIEPTASRQCEPETLRPSVSVTRTPSPSRSTEAARERDITVMPRRVKTSSSTWAASASSPGSTRSREETSTTSEPRASYALANSAPVTPDPTTISRSGSSGRS